MADLSHKHTAPRSRRRRIQSSRALLPLVGLLSVGTAAGAVILHDASGVEANEPVVRAQGAATKDVFAASLEKGRKPANVSRSAERAPIPNVSAVEAKIEGRRFAIATLKVYAAPKSSGAVLATVKVGATVDITGETQGNWTQVVHKGLPRWVESAKIATQMPLGTSACASGSAVESGLRPDTIKVHRAVCAKFPSIVRFGGVSGGGEHATGQALDIMVSGELGDQVAAFLMQNRAKLGIEYIIWRQRIWRPATSPNWRSMSDRGSATANHYDHVHVTTYGSSATQ